MIRRLKINNYKLFDNFCIEFTEGINLICGQNGSGKSAVLDVVHALRQFLAMPEYSDHIAWSVDESFPFNTFCKWLVQKSGFGDMTVSVELEGINREEFLYELCVRYNFRERKLRIQSESLSMNSKSLLDFTEGNIDMITDDDKKLSFKSDWASSGLVFGSRNNSNIRVFGESISQIYPLHLVPSLMNQDFEKDSQTLAMSGENFSAWRFYCANSHSEKQDWVVSQCKNFIYGLISVNNIKKGDWYGLSLRVSHNRNNYDIAFKELSDGQKVLFALYSILANIPDGSTVLIDEPENFLATNELQPWLNAMYDAWEDRQIQFIVISHNPQTLNWYNKEAIIFSIEGEPPHITTQRHISDDNNNTLIDKLQIMEWRHE